MHRDQLEEFVEERTAALSQANQQLKQEIVERKRAEEALRDSESKFRGLVESSSDWIWEVNVEGVYTYASPQVEAMLGYKPHEVVGKTPFDLMPPEEAERISKVFKDLIETGKPIILLENVNLHKDGRRMILETSGVPFFDADGKIAGYRGMDRDITERKRAEEEMRTQSEFLQTAIDAVTHPFYTINVKDYSISLFNKAAGIYPSEESPTCYALTHGRSEPCGKDDHPCPIEDIKVTGRTMAVFAAV